MACFILSCLMVVLSLFVSVEFFITGENVSGIIWSAIGLIWIITSYFNYKTFLNMKETKKIIEGIKD